MVIAAGWGTGKNERRKGGYPMNEYHITVPFMRETAAMLRAGDYVYLNGTVYTARDAAHKRMYEALLRGEELPFSIKDNVIYYMGPSPAREGRPIGSAGRQVREGAAIRLIACSYLSPAAS